MNGGRSAADDCAAAISPGDCAKKNIIWQATKSRLDLAFEPAARPSCGICIGAGDARYGTAAPIDGAPVAVAFGPGDTAEAIGKIDRLIELRFDHHLPGGVDQSPFAIPKKVRRP